MADFFENNNDFNFRADFTSPNSSRTEKNRDINDNLKKTLFGGYTKGSVENYVSEFKDSVEHIRDNLEFQLKEMMAEKELLSQENSLLKRQFTEAEERVQELQNEYITIKKDGNELLEGLEDDKAQLEKEKEELNMHLQNLESELYSSNSKYKQAKEYLEDIELKVNEKNEEFKKNIALLKEKEVELEASNNRVEMIKENLTELQVKLNSKEEQVQKGIILLGEKEKQIAKLEEKLEDSMNNLIIANEKLQSQEYEINRLEMSLEGPNQPLDTVRLEQSSPHIEISRHEASELHDRLKIELDDSKSEVARLTMELTSMENEVNSLLYKLNDLEIKNTDLTKQNKSYDELREKFEKLYDHYKDLGEENEKLMIDKEVLKDYVEKSQIQEREFLLLNKNSESYREHINSLELDLVEMLAKSELQGKTIQDIMSKYEYDQNKIRRLIQEKTSLQAKNVDLLEEIRVLHRELIVKEDVNKFRKANEESRYNKLNEGHNLKDKVSKTLETMNKTIDENKTMFDNNSSGK